MQDCQRHSEAPCCNVSELTDLLELTFAASLASARSPPLEPEEDSERDNSENSTCRELSKRDRYSRASHQPEANRGVQGPRGTLKCAADPRL